MCMLASYLLNGSEACPGENLVRSEEGKKTGDMGTALYMGSGANVKCCHGNKLSQLAKVYHCQCPVSDPFPPTLYYQP